MKIMSLSYEELRSVAFHDLKRFAIVVSNSKDISIQDGNDILNQFSEENKCKDDLDFGEVLNWYLEKNQTSSIQILNSMDGEICRVIIQPLSIQTAILDEGLEFVQIEEKIIGAHSSKEELIAHLESDMAKSQGKEALRQKTLEILQKQDDKTISKALIQLVISNFGERIER